MRDRKIVAQELAKLFGALSHPDRVRMIEELRAGEHDVQGLSDLLELSSSRVSQHLSVLRGLRLVQERREGKHHYYSLVASEVAEWILAGLKFTELGMVESASFSKAVKQALSVWAVSEPTSSSD